MKLPLGVTPLVLFFLWGCSSAPPGAATDAPRSFDEQTDEHARTMLREGKRVFRHDTFGSEDFWGGKLRLHEAIAGARNGGTGPGLTPRQALQAGAQGGRGRPARERGGGDQERCGEPRQRRYHPGPAPGQIPCSA